MIGLTLLAVLLSAEPPSAAADAHPFARRALVPLAISGAAFIAGGVFLGVSVAQTNEAGKLEGLPRDERLSLATNNRVGGVLLLVTGALTAGIAAFLFGFDPLPGPALSLAPMPGGAFLGLTWSTR